MKNLLVSGNPEALNGPPWNVEMSRVLHEHEYAAALLSFPASFAYETSNKQPAWWGTLSIKSEAHP
jgi:hypothetical protein